MSQDNDAIGWAMPAFQPEQALQQLRRDLRALGLTERGGTFEWQGMAVARAQVDGPALQADRVAKPQRQVARWQTRRLSDSAQLRQFLQELRRDLARWSDDD